MKKYLLWCLLAVCFFAAVLSVNAQEPEIDMPAADYQPGTVIGVWQLAEVYENASAEDRYLLEPESAASVYAEQPNLYSFNADGNGWMTIADGEDILTVYGAWTAEDNAYELRCDKKNSDDAEPAPDTDYLMEFRYDADTDLLHRYWKDDEAEGMYHDLDFVYIKVPYGAWQLKQVFSMESDESVLLDPETSQSIYADSVNTYVMKGEGPSVVWVPDELGQYNAMDIKWTGTEDGYVLDFDGLETELTFDKETYTLHQYWSDEDPDGSHLSLDFVYQCK